MNLTNLFAGNTLPLNIVVAQHEHDMHEHGHPQPVMEDVHHPEGDHSHYEHLNSSDRNLMWGMQVFTMFWVFALGSCIGSFLNVVIYRLPRGMNLNHPKSHCPQCSHLILARDNLPIIGWLILRGRCRNCQAPISSRYPIIETTVGVIFLGLLFGELLRGNANLPHRVAALTFGNPIATILWELHWDSIIIYLVHCILFTSMLAIAMIAKDGLLTPRSLIRNTLIMTALLAVFCAYIYPIHLFDPFTTHIPSAWGFQLDYNAANEARYQHHPLNLARPVMILGSLNWLAGVVMGLICSQLVKLIWNSKLNLPELTGINWILIIAGSFMGWQTVLVATLIYMLLLVLWSGSRNDSTSEPRNFNAGLLLLTELYVIVLLWKPLWNLVTLPLA